MLFGVERLRNSINCGGGKLRNSTGEQARECLSELRLAALRPVFVLNLCWETSFRNEFGPQLPQSGAFLERRILESAQCWDPPGDRIGANVH